MSSTLILIRHAHRDKSQGREIDNGISKKGEKQAMAVRDYFLSRYPDKKPRIFSSPKKRCIETVEPLAKALKLEVELSDLLLEQQETPKAETSRQFRERVCDAIELWQKEKSELVIFCSHGDWIPAVMRELFSIDVELKKGGWIEIARPTDTPTLTWVLQKLPV